MTIPYLVFQSKQQHVDRSIGFLITNALLLAIIVYSLMHVGIANNSDGRTEVLGMILGAAVAFDPLVASAPGILLGVLVGCYFAAHGRVRVLFGWIVALAARLRLKVKKS